VAEYQELRLRFERIGEDEEYRVFASGPAGEAAGTFRPPYSDLEIENLVLKLSRPRAVRRIDTTELELVRNFGAGLFDAVFNGRVRDVYRSSLASARNEGCGMRISLALTGTPELMHVPWEYLYDDPAFLSISMWTPVVRYLDLPTSRRPLKVEPPLRILAMVSSPSDFAQLDVAEERAKLEDSLSGLVRQGAVEIRWLEQATLQALQRELRRGEFHVFHYIGHGGYDRATADGVLALEDGTGRSRLVSGMELGTILADEMSLRLAVLNACEGARTSVEDPFSGVATSLVRREIPAVVAMQLEITDRAAITFACELYAALADGYAVDAALAEARKAIFADENEVEWATPVLFMRVPDGRIFDVEAPVGAHTPVEEAPIGDVERLASGVAMEAIVEEPEPAEEAVDEKPQQRLHDEEPEAPQPGLWERLPVGLVAALAGSLVVLGVAVFYPWDDHRGGRSFLHPYFGQLPNSKGGLFTALSPIAVLLVVAVASVLAWRGRHLLLAAGLLLGCGFAVSGKFLGVAAHVADTKPAEDGRADSVAFFALAMVAGLVVAVVGIQLAQHAGLRFGRDVASVGTTTSALLGLSGFLVIVGSLVAFNRGGDSGVHRSVLPNEGPLALDALVVGFALLVAALAVRYLPRELAGGIVIGLGVESAALWARYIGVPAVQSDAVGSVGLGGVIGLAGAGLALVVGVRLVAGAWQSEPRLTPSLTARG
jgi:CHAT domain-containing protein